MSLGTKKRHQVVGTNYSCLREAGNASSVDSHVTSSSVRFIIPRTPPTDSVGAARRRSPRALRVDLSPKISAPTPEESIDVTPDRSTTKRVAPAAMRSCNYRRRASTVWKLNRPVATNTVAPEGVRLVRYA